MHQFRVLRSGVTRAPSVAGVTKVLTRPAVAALAVLVVLAGSLGLGPVSPSPAAADEPVGPTTVASRATGCAAVALLGVDGRGAGWGGAATAGPELRRLAAAFVSASAPTSVVVNHLGHPFVGVRRLVGGRSHGLADRLVTAPLTRTWRADTQDVVRAVAGQLTARAAACPRQRFVLAGVGQGAGVAHRTVLRALKDPVLAGRLVGAALVSDPDRGAATSATVLGVPAAPRRGSGVVARLAVGAPDAPGAGVDTRVLSVCSRGDLVCDLRGWSVPRALEAHRSYRTPAGLALLDGTGARLAERAGAWPSLVRGQVVTTQPGVTFSRQLQAQVGPAYADGVEFTATGGLPAGVSLSRTGLLAGTVASAGSWTVALTVRNTGPVTSPRVGTVSVVAVGPGTGTGDPLSAGGQSSCQVTPAGEAWCVGSNDWGQLGDGTHVDRSSPVQVGTATTWDSIDTSGATTCAIKRSGALYCWGVNNRGQLGLGSGFQLTTPQRVGTSKDWAQVAVGWMHTCAVRTTGALFCWGENGDGQLGTGRRVNRMVPTRVGSASDWAAVVIGGWHTCAVRDDGSAWCWGRGDLGQLGTGTTGAALRPTRVASGRAWRSLDATWSSTCGVSRSGAMACWGLNDRGQLGDGTRTTSARPRAVVGAQTWSSVAVGDTFTCGLDDRRAAWCWGADTYGQLGNGTDADSATPSRVLGGRTWTGLDAGWMHTCGATSAGELQCWGNNEQGQLARGDLADRATPPGVRPRAAVPTPRRRASPEVRVTSFNVLGSQHTRPGGGTGQYAPGRIRSEWTKALLQDLDSGIVAFQELQTDQYADLVRSMGRTYDFYPANVRRPRVVWQSVMWDSSQWSFVSAIDVTVPVIGTTRPNPMVRLRNLSTGQDVYVFNVHNSSKATPERQRERNKAVRIEIAQILAQRDQEIPVLFLGDMNERATVFCKVTSQTDLRAVTGGSTGGGTCTPPRVMHLDWIFASPEFAIRSQGFLRTPQVSRITDHSLLTTRLSVPGMS